jgi:DNA-binding CsgD family transcriptional regulator
MGQGPDSGAPRPSRAMAGTWPLLRREAECATISSALIGRFEVRGIVVIGEAGVGKTTLARLCTQSLPCRVHWVVGTQSTRSIPLGVFAQFVGSATPRDPVMLLAAARKAILAQRDCVLCVDDAHLLDQLSATLLHRLAMDGSARIVATVRSGETAPDAITSLWKDGYLRRLYLRPFTKGQCVWLIEQALGGRVEGLSADLMWEASGGNALFVRHLVEGALEAGTLRQVRGVWQLRGRSAVTSELASLLDARIEQLPTDVLHTLELLTFCEPLDLDTLTGMVGAEAVEQAETRGLIRVVAEQHNMEVRFAHPLFGEVIRRRLGLAGARHLRGELVWTLRQQPVLGPGQRIRLAELSLDSVETPETALLMAAAEDAIALTDIALGARLAQAAVIHGGGLRASQLLARALFWLGDAAACEETLSPYNPDAMTEEELLRWGAVRIPNLQWSMSDTEGAHEILQLLRDRVTHPAGRVFIDGLAAMMAMGEGHLDEALMLCERVLADPRACPQTVDRAIISGTIALALMGRLDQVGEVAARKHQGEDEVDGLRGHMRAIGETWGLVFAGCFDTAEKRSTDIVRISSPGQCLAWGMVNVLASTVEVARGRFRAAVSRMEQTVAVLISKSTAPWDVLARLLLAQSYCALGQVEAGARMVAELRTRLGPDLAVLAPQVRLTEAWLAAAQGDVSTAMALAVDAGDIARRSGQRAIELRALHDAIRFGDHTSLQRMVDLAGDVGGRLAPVYAAHAAALANRDAAAVHDVAERFEQIGALLSAADAAAQAAVLFDAAGDRRRTMKAAAAAERLAAGCGGIQTPALTVTAHPLPLSIREREIADLAAQGLSNREIAERLSVSTRTVEGHIYRACTKRGLGDREELAALIRESTPWESNSPNTIGDSGASNAAD